jgi:hypothetical protein
VILTAAGSLSLPKAALPSKQARRVCRTTRNLLGRREGLGHNGLPLLGCCVPLSGRGVGELHRDTPGRSFPRREPCAQAGPALPAFAACAQGA